MREYKILLWDLDETLLDFKRCEHDAIQHSFSRFGRTVSEDVISLYSKINESYWKRLELGEVTRAELLVGRFRTLFDALLYRDLEPDAFRLIYQEELGKQAALIDGAWEILSASKGMGLKNYIVTNGVAQTQRNRMRISHLEELIDGIFISEEIGAEKPSGRFFSQVFQTLGEIDKKRVLLIGDSLSSDMKGGTNAGIDTCWYNPRRKERQEGVAITYEIRSLMDILTILA